MSMDSLDHVVEQIRETSGRRGLTAERIAELRERWGVRADRIKNTEAHPIIGVAFAQADVNELLREVERLQRILTWIDANRLILPRVLSLCDGQWLPSEAIAHEMMK